MSHTHTHDGHTHTHGGAAAQAEAFPIADAPPASVALDIGGGYGALVIYPSERYRTLEIEISPAGDPEGHRVHTGVHDRSTQAGPVLTAIFGSLVAGDYLIWVDDSTPGPTVTVEDGSVAELRLD